MTKPYDVKNERKAGNEIDKIFTNRWSPRSVSKEDFTKEDLMSLFEAARWAPSSSNNQPWRFLYSINGDKNWDKFFGLLAEFNQMWCKNAGALIVVSSKKTNDKGEDYKTHSFDAGAAWENLALQARMKGLIAHGMGGFDYDKARKELDIPDDYQVEAMLAVGSQGNVEDLHERMQKSEKPNERKSINETVSDGSFPDKWK